MKRKDDFLAESLDSTWDKLLIGNGQLVHVNQTLRCQIDVSDDKTYHDAQIHDYGNLKRNHYPWKPPLKMTVRAWASHDVDKLRGTAGFGFWNQPIMPGQRLPRLPRAIWFFFGSPPNNMALAKGVAGYGWKAATFDARKLSFLVMAPFAPLGFLLMRVPALYNRLWGIGQRAIGVSECRLDVKLTEPHIYEIEWLKNEARFWVDGNLVHQSPYSPKGPLGFIAWIDNQYAIVTPQGQFGFGYVGIEEQQWLAIDSVLIETL